MNQSSTQYQSNNKNSFNVTNNYTTIGDDERARILAWNSPLEPWKRHHDVANNRAEGVGDWVLKTGEFQEWRDGKNDGLANATLFCNGVPGAGKTFVCSLVIDTLCEEATAPNVAVACLYCDYREKEEQTLANMIRSLLKQFLTGLSDIPEEIAEAFQAARGHIGGRPPPLTKIMEWFPMVLARFERAYICVDALDEFLVEQRVELLRSLGQILNKSSNTRLFLTGRPHMQSELEANLTLPMVVITIQHRPNDIQRFLAAKLNTDTVPGAMNDTLKSEIMTNISRDFSEIFLLVTLHIDAILGEVTIAGRREKLNEITTGLSDAYTITLKRIKQQTEAKAILGIRALMWISLAERPLLVHELCHAMAVEVGSNNIDTGKLPSIEALLGCCLGLVTIDRETSTVRLIHATLQDHLRTHPDLFRNPHATIAEACLTYLTFQSVLQLPSDVTDIPLTLPLFVYASSYWAIHAGRELSESVRSLAIEVLKKYPEHAAANLFLLNKKSERELGHSSAGLSGSSYTARFSIQELVTLLRSVKSNTKDETDLWDRAPLIWAAKNGHEGVLKRLLGRGDIGPNTQDGNGRAPIHWAVMRGYEGVVKILLERADVDPNTPDNYGRTPIYWAACWGDQGVVKILLERADVDPNATDSSGVTPLHEAARWGHKGIVKILLERADVDPNAADNRGTTPITWAAWMGRVGVVKILLERGDVDPNAADNRGTTPITWAAWMGRVGVVKILLERADVDPNTADNDGRTPINWAARWGDQEVVKTLLGRADVDPNAADNDGRTPINSAVSWGHHGVVKILLERADVEPNLVDSSGDTPLHQAARRGDENIVKLLLCRPDIHPDLKNHQNDTPLMSAGLHGHEAIVKLLSDRADVYSTPTKCLSPKPATPPTLNPLTRVAETIHRWLTSNLLHLARWLDCAGSER